MSPNLAKIYKNAARRSARRRLFYIFCLNSMLPNRTLHSLGSHKFSRICGTVHILKKRLRVCRGAVLRRGLCRGGNYPTSLPK